jgi:RTA1 like protein.
MILGRLIRTLRAQHLSLIPVQWVTRIFVAGDVLSFVLQGSGGGIQTAGTLDFFKLGEKIIIGGLFVQIGFFGFFIVTSVHFHRRFACTPAATPGCRGIPWTRYLYVLYTTSALILIRSVFRVIEYVQGNAGYLISHEVFLYIFDTLLMEAVMLIFLIWYVDQLESKELADKEYLPTSSDDNTFILVGRNPEPYNTSV